MVDKWQKQNGGGRWVSTEPRLLLACDDDRLAAALIRWCREHWKTLYMAQPGTPDLAAIPCFAMVVDRNYVGLEQWELYCDFCDEIAGSMPDSFEERTEKPPGTPVLIVDELGRGEAPGDPRVPPWKGGVISFVRRRKVKQVLRTLDEVLDHRSP